MTLPETALYQNAYTSFMTEYEALAPGKAKPLSYDLSQAAEDAPWRLPFLGFLMGGELRESLNDIHSWADQLVTLQAWAQMLEKNALNEDDKWTVRRHFVEPLATWCLLQPSATRDRLGNVATNLVHQGRLASEKGYIDELKQDKNRGYLTRPNREKQLQKIAKVFGSFGTFFSRLKALDDVGFRHTTFNFRNRASHGIAPRFEFGLTQMVTRTKVAHEDLAEQPDGTYQVVKDPLKQVISYGFGGTEPLKFAFIHTITLAEFHKARGVMDAYLLLVTEVIAGLPPKSGSR